MCAWAAVAGQRRRRSVVHLAGLVGRWVCFAFTAFSKTRSIEHANEKAANEPTRRGFSGEIYRYFLALLLRSQKATDHCGLSVDDESFFFLRTPNGPRFRGGQGASARAGSGD